MPKPLKILKKQSFWHVRFREPKDFIEYKTPDWAEYVAGSVIEGAEVGMMKKKGSDKWVLQKVMIPVKVTDKEQVEKLAVEIDKKIKGEYKIRTNPKKGKKKNPLTKKKFGKIIIDLGDPPAGGSKGDFLDGLASNYDIKPELMYLISEEWEGAPDDLSSGDLYEQVELKYTLIYDKLSKDKAYKAMSNPVSLIQVEEIVSYFDKGKSDEGMEALGKLDRNLADKIEEKLIEGKSAKQIHEEIEREYHEKKESHSDKDLIIKALKGSFGIRSEREHIDELIKKIESGKHVAINDKGKCVYQEEAPREFKLAEARRLYELSFTDPDAALRKSEKYVKLFKEDKDSGIKERFFTPIDEIINEYQSIIDLIQEK